MKKYFLTYGDNSFYYSKIHLSYLAKLSGFFDHIISLGPDDLDIEFKKTFQSILTSKKGGGYWLWKHEIVKKLINEISNDDLVLYCDAGSSINNSDVAKKRFKDYFEIIGDKNVDFLRFESEIQYIENQYTTNELFSFFNISPFSKIGTSTQLQAGVMFFKKNNNNTSFLNEFRNIVDKDINFITDFYSSTNQIPEFIECRHDQSIFSLLGKTYNSVILENETEFKNRKIKQYDYPLLTVRASNHGIKDRLKLKYMKPIFGKKTKFF